jgi:hypothetical protein
MEDNKLHELKSHFPPHGMLRRVCFIPRMELYEYEPSRD